jgi:hypothetical protein
VYTSVALIHPNIFFICMFLKHVIEGKLEGRIEMTGRRGRRRKQLQDDLKEKKIYWKLKEEALHRTLWRIRFGRGYGPVVRQTTEWMNEWILYHTTQCNYPNDHRLHQHRGGSLKSKYFLTPLFLHAFSSGHCSGHIHDNCIFVGDGTVKCYWRPEIVRRIYRRCKFI